ncbi:glycosyltransferase [Mesorhizobium sp. ZMM04-5]|uniref:Glycosyltransferase n=1 Tax=Mesorhizobium marinum TaxID=3228790 RepID=A0ABV3QXA2_9HYPH
MKVLFATYPMAFHTPGGGEVQLLAYERHLADAGIEVARFDPWNPRFMEHDIVHYFSCVGGSSHFCAFVKQLGLPLVVSSSLWVTRETAAGFPIDEIRHQLFLADRVVTNSEAESAVLSGLLELPVAKFVTVRNAVDECFLRKSDPDAFRSAFDITGDIVLCVGNIEPRKNQLRLAEAMQAIEDATLVLAGGARDQDYLAAVRHAGGSKLRYVGNLEHAGELIRSAYAACTVFALPSLFETPGLAALEAAAQGAPVVITGEGSTREYFGSAARYVDPMSVSSIAAAISDALAQRLTCAAPSAFIPPTWHEVVAELKSIYSELV